MKRTSKLLALLLALTMLLSLTVTAFAAETGNTITVEKAQKGEIYSIYKMLDLSVNADKTAFTYTVNENWTNFFGNSGAGAAYVDIDDSGYVTWKADKNGAADMIAFGKAAAKYATDNSVPKAQADQTPGEENASISFANLDPGYYLITSTNGTKAIVDTTPTDPNPTITEKNVDPTISKTVEEDSTHKYEAVNDAEVGQTVNFKTVINAMSGAKNYVVHDKMSAGLTYTADSVKVYLNPKTDANGKVADSAMEVDAEGNYVVKTSGLDDGCDFHVEFKQGFCDALADGNQIVITYSATLNENAVVAAANTNDTKLTWGQSSETLWSQTKTYTWEMDVLKYGNGDKTKVLKDAQFVLLNTTKDKVAKLDDTGKITEWVEIPSAGEDGKIAIESWPTGTIQITNDQGKIFVMGLDSADKYYLREVKAPAGYNLLAEDTEFSISRVLNLVNPNPTELGQQGLTVEISNQSGTELPSTGGMGTTIFYVVGSILLVGAAVLLITKKRMSAAQ